MTQTILLTGGAGYIGSHTYLELIKAGYHVVILDNFSNARLDVIERLEVLGRQPVTYYKGDILDSPTLERIFSDHKIDAVIHFAALKAVGESTEKPLEYFQTNIAGLYNLLAAMQKAQVWTLVFSSSATVYGEPDVSPTPEDAQRRYMNPYGYTKLSCEQSLEQIAASDERWSFGILRYFNPAGAHDTGLIGEDPNDVPNNLMPYIAKVATGDLKELSVFGDDYDTPDGTGVRDYIHVMDLAYGHVQSVGTLLETKTGHTINLGTGTGYSVLEMLQAYERACGKALSYKITPRRPGDVPVYCANPDKAKQVINFQAQRGLDEMCASSWNWVSRRKNTPQ